CSVFDCMLTTVFDKRSTGVAEIRLALDSKRKAQRAFGPTIVLKRPRVKLSPKWKKSCALTRSRVRGRDEITVAPLIDLEVAMHHFVWLLCYSSISSAAALIRGVPQRAWLPISGRKVGLSDNGAPNGTRGAPLCRVEDGREH